MQALLTRLYQFRYQLNFRRALQHHLVFYTKLIQCHRQLILEMQVLRLGISIAIKPPTASGVKPTRKIPQAASGIPDEINMRDLLYFSFHGAKPMGRFLAPT